MDAVAAKQFLISKVLQEAESSHVQLSEVERKMLYFTEVHPSLPDILEVNAEFERDYDADEYENKIAQLLKGARAQDRQTSPIREQEWKDALDALKKEDHYILVMVGIAFGYGSRSSNEHRTRDFLIYIAIAIGLVLCLLLATLWRAGH
jgi:hypothetical protein